MEQRLSLVTLGCADQARAKAFYKDAFGWTPFMEMDDIAFFDLGGVVLAVWTHDGLKADSHTDGALGAYRGSALAYNARTEAEVDAIFADLRARGAAILKAPVKAEWGGYSGYIADPDGHAWEIAYNPGWPIGPDGRLQIVKS
ncbi:MAG: VOC family protein [Alphaproteobacteria bacterium]|nr:VOC family protein [Alphaproteobacteria bacterium]